MTVEDDDTLKSNQREKHLLDPSSMSMIKNNTKDKTVPKIKDSAVLQESSDEQRIIREDSFGNPILSERTTSYFVR